MVSKITWNTCTSHETWHNFWQLTMTQWNLFKPTIFPWDNQRCKVKGIIRAIMWTKWIILLVKTYQAPFRILCISIMYYFFGYNLAMIQTYLVSLRHVFFVSQNGVEPCISTSWNCDGLWCNLLCFSPDLKAKHNPIMNPNVFDKTCGESSPSKPCSHNLSSISVVITLAFFFYM